MRPRPFWAAVLLGAGLLTAVYFLLRGDLPQTTVAVPAAVAPGDQEIAFLNPATSGTTWERLVAGLHYLRDHVMPGQVELDDSQAYPKATAVLPAVALRRKGRPGTLWFRWYKLTGQNSIPVWLEALTRRSPPPLAVLGGGSSDRAKELAEKLKGLCQAGWETPVLLLTTATADYVDPIPDNPPPLMRIYDGRTFRFCFSNRQMARATLDFLASQPLLQPRPGLIGFISWKDDPFTHDLAYQFRDLLWEKYSDVFLNIDIPYSIGPLTEPNAGERRAVLKLLEELKRVPREQPVLLVIPGGPVPVRRVLRDLFRTAPGEAKRIVVATADAIDFNTVFRDRALSWKIQDVPCPLVLFCHRHPMCNQAEPRWAETPKMDGRFEGLASTQDLLLYADIGQALAMTTFTDAGLLSRPQALAEGLAQATDAHGQPVFQSPSTHPVEEPDAQAGNRRYHAAKYLVLLEPLREDRQIKPEADVALFEKEAGGWQLRRRLRLQYDESGVRDNEVLAP